MKDWERYEEASREILKKLCEHFDLGDVQGKQIVKGLSGAEWEIDGVGISYSTEKLVVIECRLTKGRQSQSKIAALAFTMKDISAERGIIVTPNPLQKGAEVVARSSGITHFKLDSKSTSSDFLAQLIGKIFLGIPSIEETSKVGMPGIKIG